MKKTIAVWVLAILMVFGAAFAETAAVENADLTENWYELSADNTVLTVRLPGNTKTGLTWSFEISASNVVELITNETIVGESEGMAGAPTTYVASFMATAGIENSGSLILTCADESDASLPAVYTRVLEIGADANNCLTINSVLTQEPFAEWVEVSNDSTVLTVRMPDANWSFEIVDPEAIELITCEDSEGVFVASFMPTLDQFGFAEIVFTSDDGLTYRNVDVFISENGQLDVSWVGIFDILEPVQAAG